MMTQMTLINNPTTNRLTQTNDLAILDKEAEWEGEAEGEEVEKEVER